jgi:hypothetical protein
MKRDEMGKTCSTHGSEKRIAHEISIGKHKSGAEENIWSEER